MNEHAHGPSNGHEGDEDPPSLLMYIGIVTVSLAAFYVTMLLTKLAY